MHRRGLATTTPRIGIQVPSIRLPIAVWAVWNGLANPNFALWQADFRQLVL